MERGFLNRAFKSKSSFNLNGNKKEEKTEEPQECVVFCVDNSEWMRDEDYVPSRWSAQCQAVQLYLNQGKKNTWNGLISTAGKRANIHLSPTQDLERVYQSLDEISIGGVSKYQDAFQLARTIVRNRNNESEKFHIVWFCGSPLKELDADLMNTAHMLQMRNISVDIINFGEMDTEKTEKLQNFFESVNEQDTSHLVTCLPAYKASSLEAKLAAIEHNQRDVNSNLNPSMNSICQRAFGGIFEEERLIKKPDDIERENQRKLAVKKAEQMGMGLLSLPGDITPGCRKTVLDRQRYKTIVKSAVPVSAVALSLKGDKKLLLLVSPNKSKKLICTYKAGRMDYNMDEKLVTPLLDKGEVSLWILSETYLHFQWKDIKSGEIKFDVQLTAGDVSYDKVSECSSGDVYMLTVKSNSNNAFHWHFFWNQEPKKSDKDKEFYFSLKYHLKNLESSYHSHFDHELFSQPGLTIGELDHIHIEGKGLSSTNLDASDILEIQKWLSSHKSNVYVQIKPGSPNTHSHSHSHSHSNSTSGATYSSTNENSPTPGRKARSRESEELLSSFKEFSKELNRRRASIAWAERQNNNESMKDLLTRVAMRSNSVSEHKKSQTKPTKEDTKLEEDEYIHHSQFISTSPTSLSYSSNSVNNNNSLELSTENPISNNQNTYRNQQQNCNNKSNNNGRHLHKSDSECSVEIADKLNIDLDNDAIDTPPPSSSHSANDSLPPSTNGSNRDNQSAPSQSQPEDVVLVKPVEDKK